MANFCGKCGKPLQEGEVCSCTQGSVQGQSTTMNHVQPQQQTTPVQPVQQVGNGQQMQGNQPVYGQPMQGNQPGFSQQVQGNQPVYGQPMQGNQAGYNQQMQGNQSGYGQPMQGGYPNGQPSQASQKASQAADAAGNYLKKAWSMLTGIWRQPATNTSKVAQEKSFSEALGIIGAEAILLVMFICVFINRINSSFKDMGALDEDQLMPYLKPAIFTILFVAVSACIFAGIFVIVSKQLANIHISFKRAICLYSVRSAAMLPFILISMIIAFFVKIEEKVNGSPIDTIKDSLGGFYMPLIIILIVFEIGRLLGYYFVYTAAKEDIISDENKKIYRLFITFAIFIILTAIVQYWLQSNIIGDFFDKL